METLGTFTLNNPYVRSVVITANQQEKSISAIVQHILAEQTTPYDEYLQADQIYIEDPMTFGATALHVSSAPEPVASMDFDVACLKIQALVNKNKTPDTQNAMNQRILHEGRAYEITMIGQLILKG